MFWLLIICAFILYFYYYLLKPQLVWTNRHVKQRTPIPILGDSMKAFFGKESLMELTKNIYNHFKKERYCGLYQGTKPTLMLRDPELIKQITVKDFDHFVDHVTFFPDSNDPLWESNLLTLKGSAWGEMRSTLSPSFTTTKMRSMFALIDTTAQQYVDFYLKQNKKIIDVELKDSFTRFASDVIGNCAFGVTVDSLKDPTNEFYMYGKEVTESSGFIKNFKLTLLSFTPKIAKLFKVKLFTEATRNFFVSLVNDTVKVREEQNIVRPDMINLMMEARKEHLSCEETTTEESNVDGKRKMTVMDMAAQVFLFFFAGFDTISTMMSFMCFELALNPVIQQRLRSEVDDTYRKNNGKLSYDSLKKMKYMDMILSETLRKHPPFVTVDRLCTKAYTIAAQNADEHAIHLKPGDALWIPIVAIHHDDKFYPNPEKFDPERFSDENKPKIKTCTYIPFGNGPRNCIASRFAIMEVKTLIFHVLSKFELIVIDKTRVDMKLTRNQFKHLVEGGFWVGFKRGEL